MGFQKTRFTKWLIIFLFSLPFLSGCAGPKIQLGFPLSDGNSWIYQGTISYKMGSQEQEMPPLAFKLKCRQLAPKANFPFELSMTDEGEPFFEYLFVQTPKGIVNPLTGELWLPEETQLGKKWTITINNQRVKLVARSQTTTTVQAGTFPTYLINFNGPGKGFGSLWLDPEVGVITMDWTSRTANAKASTHLELASYSLP